MKITWLGQAGLLFETNGKTIIVDPYLSDSVKKIEPQNYRRVAVDEQFLSLKPDMILLTHNHLDHTDPETLCHYLGTDSQVTVLASGNAWQNVRKAFGGIKNNYVQFNRGTEWTEGELYFKAVYAEHSDDKAIGVVMRAEGKTYYITGDTLYSEKVFESLPSIEFEMLFLPVNGVGNNMNFIDAQAFAKRIKAKYNVPVHFGLFDDINGYDIPMENKKLLNLYTVVELD